MPYWLQALLWGAIGLVVYLLLLKRLRKTHRPKDVPEIVLPGEEEEANDPARKDDDTRV